MVVVVVEVLSSPLVFPLLNIPLRMLDEPSEFEDEVVVDFLFCFPNLGLPEVEGRAITPLLPVQVGNPDSALKHCRRDSLSFETASFAILSASPSTRAKSGPPSSMTTSWLTAEWTPDFLNSRDNT